MASFNPKMLAHEVAKGLVSLNPNSLRKYKPKDLKALLNQLTAEQRKIRATQIAPDNMMEIKEKNRQLQHVNQAITIINGYVKKHHIRL